MKQRIFFVILCVVLVVFAAYAAVVESGWTRTSNPGIARTNLATHNANNITINTISDARLSANVSLLGQSITEAEIDISNLPDTELLINQAGSIDTIPQTTFVTPAQATNIVQANGGGFFDTNAAAANSITTDNNVTFEGDLEIVDLTVTGNIYGQVPQQVFTNIAAMVASPNTNGLVFVSSYWGTNVYGNGSFRHITNASTTNFGTVFLSAYGGYWHRIRENTNKWELIHAGVPPMNTDDPTTRFDAYQRMTNMVVVSGAEAQKPVILELPPYGISFSQTLIATNWKGVTLQGSSGASGVQLTYPNNSSWIAYQGPSGGDTAVIRFWHAYYCTIRDLGIETSTPVYNSGPYYPTNNARYGLEFDQTSPHIQISSGNRIENVFVRSRGTNVTVTGLAISRTSLDNCENFKIVNFGAHLGISNAGEGVLLGNSANSRQHTIRNLNIVGGLGQIGLVLSNGGFTLDGNNNMDGLGFDYKIVTWVDRVKVANHFSENNRQCFWLGAGASGLPLEISGYRSTHAQRVSGSALVEMHGTVELDFNHNDLSLETLTSQQVFTNDPGFSSKLNSRHNEYGINYSVSDTLLGLTNFLGGWKSEFDDINNDRPIDYRGAIYEYMIADPVTKLPRTLFTVDGTLSSILNLSRTNAKVFIGPVPTSQGDSTLAVYPTAATSTNAPQVVFGDATIAQRFKFFDGGNVGDTFLELNATNGRGSTITLKQSGTNVLGMAINNETANIWYAGSGGFNLRKDSSSGTVLLQATSAGDLYQNRTIFTGDVTMQRDLGWTGAAGFLGLRVNNMTTAQRDALTAASGNIIYNTTAGDFQFYDSAWATMVGSSVPFTATRVPFAGAGGLLTDDAGMTYIAGTDTLTVGELVVTAGITADAIAAFNNITTLFGQFTGSGAGLTTLNGSSISSGTVAPARLGTGSGGSTKFLREDSTWQTITGGGTNGGGSTVKTNFVLNTIYTNNSGAVQLYSGLISQTTAGVNGNSGISVLVSTDEGATFVATGGDSIGTTIGVTLAQSYTNTYIVAVGPTNQVYLTNISTGAGNSALLVAGSGQLTTVGAGTSSSGAPGGSDTQIQYNNGGVLDGDAGLTYNDGTDALTVAGALTGGTLVSESDITADGIFIGDGSGLNTLNGSQVTSGTVAADRLGSGGASGEFLRYDNTWQPIAGGSASNGISYVNYPAVRTIGDDVVQVLATNGTPIFTYTNSTGIAAINTSDGSLAFRSELGGPTVVDSGGIQSTHIREQGRDAFVAGDGNRLIYAANGTTISAEFADATAPIFGGITLDLDAIAAGQTLVRSGTSIIGSNQPVQFIMACSDETTTITTGTAKATFRAPYAFTVTAVRLSLTTASSSGLPTIDINENGTTILSTKLTCDASEKTSTTAATPAVISDTAIADDAELTFDFDVAGTGATGVKVTILGYR